MTLPTTERIPLPLETYKSKLPFPSSPTGHRAIDWALKRLPELEQGTAMLDRIIEQAKIRHTKIILLSPHEDDIPLSVGGFVSRFSPEQLYSITVFTRALESSQTPDLKRYLSNGFSSVVDLYEKRHEEDIRANETLGIPRKNQYHLGFIDAPWRVKADTTKKLYPKRKSQLGRVSSYERDTLMPELAKRISSVVSDIAGTSTNYLVLTPAALGMTNLNLRPVDHVITRDVTRTAFPATHHHDHVVYYGEYPYLSEAVPDASLTSLPALHEVSDHNRKREAIEKHQSQISRLFDPKSITSVGAMPTYFPPELFFVRKENLAAIAPHSVSYYGSSSSGR